MKLDNPILLRSNAYIDGRWEAADSGATLVVADPASGDQLGEVPLMGAAETTRAIAAAEAALPAWRAKTAKERAAILRRWFDLIVSHGEDLARMITAECGKPLSEAKGEVGYGASFV